MKKRNEIKAICPFCGMEYTRYIEFTDDGVNWEGHGNSNPSYSRSEVMFCCCGAEKRMREMLQKVKPMCYNCKYYKSSFDGSIPFCECKENIKMIQDVSEIFDINMDCIALKHPERCCKNYKLDLSKLVDTNENLGETDEFECETEDDEA